MINYEIDPAKYRDILAAYVALGPRAFNRVAKQVGVNYRTARKAWEAGWPESGEWARPISEIYEEAVKADKNVFDAASVERVISLDAVFSDALQSDTKDLEAEEETAEPEKIVLPESPPMPPIVEIKTSGKPVRVTAAEVIRNMPTQDEINHRVSMALLKVRESAAQAIEEEAQMLMVTRNNVTGINVMINRLLSVMGPYVEAAAERLKLDVTSGRVTAVKASQLLDRLAKSVNTLAMAGSVVIKNQRLSLGLPESISEQRNKDTTPKADGAPVDAQAEERARLSRNLTLLAQAQLPAIEDEVDSEPAEQGIPAEFSQ